MKVYAHIDRIEGDVAVLLLGDQLASVQWPLSLLPEQATEGDVVAVTLEIDEQMTHGDHQEISELMKQLLKR